MKGIGSVFICIYSTHLGNETSYVTLENYDITFYVHLKLDHQSSPG